MLSIDGEETAFSLLADALRAFDASIVNAKGAETRDSELNLPEEWSQE